MQTIICYRMQPQQRHPRENANMTARFRTLLSIDIQNYFHGPESQIWSHYDARAFHDYLNIN